MILLIDIFAALFWILVILTLDSNHEDKKSFPIIIRFFFYGMLSLAVALALYELILIPNYEDNLHPIVVDMLFVGPIEEFSKFIVFFLLVKRFKSIKEPKDGILQAITVGLAFGIVENMFYGWEYGVETMLMRSLLTLLGHMSYAAFWGFYFSWIEYLHLRKDNGKYPLGMLITSIAVVAAVHGLYNAMLDTQFPWLSLVVKACSITLAVSLYIIMRRSSPFTIEPLSNYRHAIAQLSYALKRHPESVSLNYRLAQYYIHAHRYNQAAVHAGRAYQLQHDNSYLLALAGITRFLAGNMQTGTRMLDLAIGLMKKDEQADLIHRMTLLIKRKTDLDNVLAILRDAQLAGKHTKKANDGVHVQYKDIGPAPGLRKAKESAVVN